MHRAFPSERVMRATEMTTHYYKHSKTHRHHHPTIVNYRASHLPYRCKPLSLAYPTATAQTSLPLKSMNMSLYCCSIKAHADGCGEAAGGTAGGLPAADRAGRAAAVRRGDSPGGAARDTRSGQPGCG